MAAAIDFVGATASADFGLASLRKGGRLVVVGLFGGALELALPLLPMRSVAIEGSYVGSLQEMRELMALAHAGKLAAMPLRRMALQEVPAALDDLRAGRIVGRAVVAPQPSA
jgi:alcohol dehydrogenase/propanol-preferring alcohol dehydrogenase